MNAPEMLNESDLGIEVKEAPPAPATPSVAPATPSVAPATPSVAQAKEFKRTKRVEYIANPAGLKLDVIERHRTPEGKWVDFASATFDLRQMASAKLGPQFTLRGLKSALIEYAPETTVAAMQAVVDRMMEVGPTFFNLSPATALAGFTGDVPIPLAVLVMAYAQVNVGMLLVEVYERIRGIKGATHPETAKLRREFLMADPAVVAVAQRIMEARSGLTSPAPAEVEPDETA